MQLWSEVNYLLLSTAFYKYYFLLHFVFLWKCKQLHSSSMLQKEIFILGGKIFFQKILYNSRIIFFYVSITFTFLVYFFKFNVLLLLTYYFFNQSLIKSFFLN